MPDAVSRTFGEERDDAELAAEYVLGVLDGGERRAVERRAARDPAFAAEIAAWSERLGPLAGVVDPIEPPPGLWGRIAADLDRMTRRPPQAEGVAERPRRRRVSAIWQWLGLAAMGLAAASIAALILVGTGRIDWMAGTPRGTMTATLASQSGQPLFTVVIDRSNNTATLIPVASPGSDGRVPELWLVPPGGASPRSLGVVPADHPLRLVIKDSGVDMPDAALAVSLEPKGGSPTGLPTGPVVASGALHSV